MMIFYSGEEELEKVVDLAIEQSRVDGQATQSQRQKANGLGADQRVLGRNRRTQRLDELQKLDLP